MWYPDFAQAELRGGFCDSTNSRTKHTNNARTNGTAFSA
jgi:hypothetical protein